MSASQSYLSSPQFGYDLVVATTQGSINAALQEFLSSGSEPEVVVCYVADSDGNPTPIDYQTLVANANGSDPFSVPPNADPNTDTDLQNLFKARFLAGFKAQIGVPPGYVPADAPPETPPKPTIPDLVVLGADVSSVTFNLLCSEFIVVQYTPSSGYSPAQWLSMSQPDGNAWIFSSTVDLHLVQGQPPYSNLPLAIQNQILNLGGTAFSVQQLLFDLDNAKLQTMPTISGVPSGSPLDTLLTTYFLDEYFNTMQQNGQPLLGCTITVGTSGSSVPAPSITPSNLTFETCPLLDSNGQPIVANSNQDGQAPTQSQLDACTLNYLCAAGGDSLPPAVPFDWNWVEENEQSQFDGVMAINRNAFVNYLRSKLDGYVAQNCLQPHVDVNLDKVGWSMSNGTPTVTTPASGAIVLSYSYQADDEHSSALDANKIERLHPFFDRIFIEAARIPQPGEKNLPVCVRVDRSLEDAVALVRDRDLDLGHEQRALGRIFGEISPRAC